MKWPPSFILTAIVFIFWTNLACAHEMRPAFLEIVEKEAGNYEVLWKVPSKAQQVLHLRPVFPENCSISGQTKIRVVAGGRVENSSLSCDSSGLKNREISIDGLSDTPADVVVRIEYLDGNVQSLILKPDSTSFIVLGKQHWLQVALDYTKLGVEHILGGIDHLLFVLGLLLIVRGKWLLVKTITSFTIAHSITLGAATLGWVNLRQAPVEAVIALSILFLASEITKQSEGQVRLTEKYPWIVAFIFGLLHGFGFAGALNEIGLPQSEIPLALLMFNVGVELGQLFFVSLVILLGSVAAKFIDVRSKSLRYCSAYTIGALAAFWFIQRIAVL